MSMRKGSMEYWPHRRAKKQMPRVRTWKSVFVGVPGGSMFVRVMLVQRNPDSGMQLVPRLLLLKTPREKSAISTIAIMSIAHPYVIRYSIALWSFTAIRIILCFLMKINISCVLLLLILQYASSISLYHASKPRAYQARTLNIPMLWAP